MNRRFFEIKDDKAFELLEKQSKEKESIVDKYSELKEELGADEVLMRDDGYVIGMSFDFEPDYKSWKKVKPSSFNRKAIYFPKRNSKVGKALYKKFKDIGNVPNSDDSGVMELYDANKMVFMGMTLSKSSLIVLDNPTRAFISMAWVDTPTEELERRLELAEYESEERDLKSLIEVSKWEKPDCLIELKEWELKKIIDEQEESD